MKALVFNCGSSSLKFELLELDESLRTHNTLASGKVEEIGARATAKFIGPDGKESRAAAPASNHQAAALHALRWMESLDSQPLEGLEVVAHRVVHGGGEVEEPRIVDESVYAALERATQFAPLVPSPYARQSSRGTRAERTCVMRPFEYVSPNSRSQAIGPSHSIAHDLFFSRQGHAVIERHRDISPQRFFDLDDGLRRDKMR